MERVNFHTHTCLCRHAVGKAKDYAIEARDKGFTKLGFSDHLPFPDFDYDNRMKYEEMGEYFDQLQEARDILGSKVQFLRGFEAEYIPGEDPYYEKLLNETGMDYLVLGQHFMYGETRDPLWLGKFPSSDYYPAYTELVLEAMKTGYFCFFAHPDMLFMNPLAWDTECERYCDRVIDAAVKYDYILEYNAYGIRKGLAQFPDGERYRYPHQRFWDKVAQTNIRVLIGSDAHAPEMLYDESVIKAHENARKMHLNVVTDIGIS